MVKNIFIGLFVLLFSNINIKADCTINLTVVNSEQSEEVPQVIISNLTTRLQQLLTNSGVVIDNGLGQFFISGKFNHILCDVLPGPPTQNVVHTDLSLYIGDLKSETIYAMTTIELRGVGTSLQRAYINALKGLNARRNDVKDFIDNGRNKIVDYYNKNYPQIISQAKKAAASHNYEEALWRLSFVPECCNGYDEVMNYTEAYFQSYIDQEGLSYLNAANAAWASHPDENGAEQALAFLQMIDPESTSYNNAVSLMQEIKKSVKSDRDFELRTKYNDDIDLQKRRIQAAKEVGVAYGQGQQPQTTNIGWLR